MKTVEEHNAMKLKYFYGDASHEWQETDIECPDCFKPLLINNSMVVMSRPEQRHVKCECGYWGSVY